MTSGNGREPGGDVDAVGETWWEIAVGPVCVRRDAGITRPWKQEAHVARMSDPEFEDEASELLCGIGRLHGEDRIAAACRGSANPAALGWLADTLALSPGDRVADLGAGLGGPAAWMRSYIGCSVIASDPSPAAVAGAHQLFGLVTVQATAASTPFAAEGFDAVMLLGVLSVVEDRASVVREARRVGRRVGVLDYCSASEETLHVGGSRFPSLDELRAELSSAWDQVSVVRVDHPTPASWKRAAERAHDGVPLPSSEREVVSAIETGRLVAHALVGR